MDGRGYVTAGLVVITDGIRPLLRLEHPDIRRRFSEREIEITGGDVIGHHRTGDGSQNWLMKMLDRFGRTDRPLGCRVHRLQPGAECAVSQREVVHP